MGYSTVKRGIFLFTNNVATSVSASTSNELLHSHEIPANTMAPGDVLEIYSRFTVTNSANDKTFRLYMNTSASLSGATLIGTFLVTAILSTFMARLLPIVTNTTLIAPDVDTSAASQFGQLTVADETVTIPTITGTVFVLIAGQKESSGETLTANWSFVKVVKE